MIFLIVKAICTAEIRNSAFRRDAGTAEENDAVRRIYFLLQTNPFLFHCGFLPFRFKMNYRPPGPQSIGKSSMQIGRICPAK